MAITSEERQWKAGDKIPIVDDPIMGAFNPLIKATRADSRRPKGVAGREITSVEGGRRDLSECTAEGVSRNVEPER